MGIQHILCEEVSNGCYRVCMTVETILNEDFKVSSLRRLTEGQLSEYVDRMFPPNDSSRL